MEAIENWNIVMVVQIATGIGTGILSLWIFPAKKTQPRRITPPRRRHCNIGAISTEAMDTNQVT